MTVRRSRIDQFRLKNLRRRQREQARRKALRHLQVETLEQRRLLATGPQLVGIQYEGNDFLTGGETRHIAPKSLTLVFDGNQSIDPSTLGAIQVGRSGGDDQFGDATDVSIQPGYIGLGETPNEVILRFAETLPDDLYRVQITGSGLAPLKNTDGDRFNDGQDYAQELRLDLGAQVVAVVPQPITRLANGNLSQARNQIVVYFNNDDLDPADAGNPLLYQLLATQKTVSNQDDGLPINPQGVAYDAGTDRAVLTFAADLEDLAGEGILRLRIGTDEGIPTQPVLLTPATDVGSSFGTAYDLSTLVGVNVSQLISAAIDPEVFVLDFPGGNDEPGHPEIPEEIAGGYDNHINPAFGADSTDGVLTISYNFQKNYGTNLLNGNPLTNLITDRQKDVARRALDMWANFLGVQFQETASSGLTIVTGDPQALDPDAPDVVNHALNKPAVDRNFIVRVDPAYQDSMLILDNAQQWNDTMGGDWFETALTGIGFMLGLERATDLPPSTLMAFGSDFTFPGADNDEPIFLGNHDILHGTYVHRPDSNDIDMYRFEIESTGWFTAETFAERQLPDASLLDTYLTLYRENTDGTREVIARNDDYFSEDSLIQLTLEPGVYYLGVTASGNSAYNPEFPDTGLGGKTQGLYDLRVDFQAEVADDHILNDATGTALDGDGDGTPGGAYNFWFQAADESHTIIVDKVATTNQLGAKATFDKIKDALPAAVAGDVVRIVGNGGLDGNLNTIGDNFAYEIGIGALPGQVLSDGKTMNVPKDVTVMIDAGAIFKLGQARIGVGSSSLSVDRSSGALQVLGTPDQSVYFTSFRDESIGYDSYLPTTTPKPSDWGGIVFRADLDNASGRFNYEQAGIFLNYVNHADIRFGGGNVDIESVKQTVTPLQLTETRPTISFNQITRSADAPISADPDSFRETNFHAPVYQQADVFTSDYQRVGPDIHGNLLIENSNNGLFVRITTPAGNIQKELTVPGRFDDTDVVHIVAENLKIQGTPGGPIVDAAGHVVARLDARLAIDPGVVVKLEGSRIEVGFGAQLLAEGLDGQEVIFTARADDRYGAGGTFDTNGDIAATSPARGDWGGIFVGHTGSASIDHALLTFGGGTTKIEGTFKAFNILEIHQADVRVANSVIEQNANGQGGQGPADRFGRGYNESATIYVRGAQPVLLGNTIQNNAARALTINANSFTDELIDDPGRSTGMIDVVGSYPANQGPLVRENVLWNNALNGLDVRGEVLTTMSVWDDTDIVHVLRDEQVVVPDVHSSVGLRLESNPGSSLIVKLDGQNDNFDPYVGAGITATGRQLGIDDRIGGTVHVVGQADFPVVLTSLFDDTVGAGLTPAGDTLTDTNNDGQATLPAAGDWRSIRLEEFANDRNVELIVESEARSAKAPGENATPDSAQYVGDLAWSEVSSDDNLRLGFEVLGVLTEANDIDVYSFGATAGTEIWLDIDRTTQTLNSVVELIDALGNVVARSDDSLAESAGQPLFYDPFAIDGDHVNPLQKVADEYQPHNASGEAKDFFSLNVKDAGLRLVLPGAAGTTSTYHVRVRSSSNNLDQLDGGLTAGSYQLQIRLRETDEVPGVTVRYADIRYATNGVEAYGLPGHSPLVGEVAEDENSGGPENNNSIPWGTPAATGPQDLGNLLATDRGVISLAGLLSDRNDIDVYEFQVNYDNVGADGIAHTSVVFDIDYADGLTRPDTNLIVFDSTGRPILFGSDSNIADDRPRPLTSNGDMEDVSRGSVGTKDAFIGPVALPVGTYFVAVVSDDWTADELVNNSNVRMQPIDSILGAAQDDIQEDDRPGSLFDRNWVQLNQTGSGLWNVFDLGGVGAAVPTEMYDDSLGNSPWVLETEPNSSIATAQDLERELWTLGYDSNVSDPALGWDSTQNPHVSVVRGTGDTTRDYYAFEVPFPGTMGFFDIDIDWDEILDPTGYMDANLRLWSERGQLLTVADNMATFDPGSNPKPDSLVNTDPQILYTFAQPGRYIIEVTRTIPPFLYQPPQVGDLYTLHVSLSAHDFGGASAAPENFALIYSDFGSIGDVVVNASNTQPIVITSGNTQPLSPYCLSTGSQVQVFGVTGNTNANNDLDPNTNPPPDFWTATYVGPNRFQLTGRNGNAAYTGGGVWSYTGPKIDGGSYGSLLSKEFDLSGYSPDDAPSLYFDYFMDVLDSLDEHLFNVYVVRNGERLNDGNPIARKNVELLNIQEWRQAVLDLSEFAGLDQLKIEFEFDANTNCTWTLFTGVAIDNVIIGFAERGEVIMWADSNPAFEPDPFAPGDGTLFGEYQLEIRLAEQYGTSKRATMDEFGSLEIVQQFDTNARLTQQTTLVAPAGSDVADGQVFTISDGLKTVTFEYDSDGGVAAGHIAVAVQATDTEADVALELRDVINSPQVQATLDLTAGLLDGTNTGPNVNNAKQVNLYGEAIVDGIDAIVYNFSGDSNRFRDQGQLLIHSNFITDSRDFGIVVDAGSRDREERVPVGFLGSHPAPARNLRELNNDPDGGLVPGATVENNVIANEGLGGIHVSGNMAPFEIVPPADTPTALSGEFICDGQTITVHAYRTTVTFEFEDISGGSLPCGSNVRGGDGWTPGNIPIYYRQSSGNWLYPPRSIPPHAYFQFEMVAAIRDAVQGSILVTNGTTLVSSATITESRWARDPNVVPGTPGPPLLAVYLDNVTSVVENIQPLGSRQVPLGLAAQPFVRVINNTIFGDDGTRGFYPGTGLAEPNDTMATAVETQQGRQANPQVFTDTAMIGDGLETPNDASLDVDLYRLQLEIGERVTVNIDTLGLGSVDSIVRLFDARGVEVAFSDDDAAPGEILGTDSYIDFTATTAGTYYVGVSGKGNEAYDPESLGNRTGPASDGDYQIQIDVIAPRTWVLDALDGTQIPDGTTFTVSDIYNTVTYEFDDVNNPGVTAGNIAVPYDSRVVQPQGFQTRGPGYRVPEMAVTMANTIGQGLVGVTATALGGIAGATPALTRNPAIDGDTSWWGIVGLGHDTPDTAIVATTERYVVITGASDVTGDPIFLQMLRPADNENIDQLLPETGVLVSERASPTLLNNVLANLNAGIWQDTSPSTVVGASIFQHNDVTDANVGTSADDFNTTLGNYEPLFVNAADGQFYPAPGAYSIDSALDSLEERDDLERVKQPLGIAVSPILAPQFDAVGLLRSDDPDVETPSGLGANVFKDRGGLDRADFIGPDAVLVHPLDNDAAGVDKDPTETVVQLTAGLYDHFSIQLVDGLQASQAGEGVGINDLSIDASKVTLTADGQLLTEGVDYEFRYDGTTNTIRLTPVNGLWDNDTAYVITLPNSDRFVVEIPSGGDVKDGDTFFITDNTGGTVTFEFESGYNLQVPETLTLQIPEQGVNPGGITDGQRFVVVSGLGQFYTFEYDANTPPNFLPGNFPINIASATTIDQLADATVAALNASGIGIAARNLGDGAVHVGAPATYTIDTTLSTLTRSGEAGVVADGQTIVISDGVATPVVFEFDTNGASAPGNVRIQVSPTSTQAEIGDAIAAAIAGSSVGLDAQSFGDGHVYLGGTELYTVNASLAPKLVLSGQPGVRTSTRIRVPSQGAGPGGIADGQWFRISDGLGNTATFEFDRDGIVQSGNRPVLFTTNSTVDQLANTIIAAINLAPVGLAPQYLGGGRIALNDGIRHTTDVAQSALTKTGVPGGVVTIDYLPDDSFAPDDFAPLILGAIHDSLLTDVTTTYRGGDTYFLNGIKTVSGLTNFFIGSIEDMAGNDLRPNQPTNQTQFTILMPGVELDFGDAPAPYPTLFDANGARHVITEDPLYLGAGVSPDANGQPTDDDDGVVFGSVFNLHLTTSVIVTASDRGALDAWIDFNRDGDWSDPGEQVVVSQLLSPGENVLSIGTPPTALTNDVDPTWARFRLSRAGALRPNGLAADGEVEDYAVMVVSGTPPVARNDSLFLTNEDTPLPIAISLLLLNDTDVDDDLVGLRDFDASSMYGASITADGLGNLIYNPTSAASLAALNAGEDVIDTFTYSVVDALGLPSNRATVAVMVTGVNDAPLAVDDQYDTDEDHVLTIAAAGVLTNDSDPDAGDVISIVAADSESELGAIVTVNADGSFTYDPTAAAAVQAAKAGETVFDTFTYTIEDSQGEPATAMVTLIVTGLNDRPVAGADSYATDADKVLDVAPAGVLSNDTDADAEAVLTVLSADDSSSMGALVTVNPDGSFSYDPTGVVALKALQQGVPQTDTFRYTVTDENNATTTQTVTVTVTGVNDDPVAFDDQYAIDQNKVLQVAAPGVLGNDSDPDAGDTLLVGRYDAGSEAGAVVTVNPNGSFTYNPTGSSVLDALAPGQTYPDTFTYDAADGHGGSSTATVTVLVRGVNNAPNAVNDLYTTGEDSPLSVNAADGVLKNDTDPDGQPIEVVNYDSLSPLGATIVMNSDGSFTYNATTIPAVQMLNVGDVLSDTFTYTIADNYTQRLTDTGTVTVRINGVNDVPVAENDSVLALRTGATALNVLANDHDIDGTLNPASVAIGTTLPQHGTAVPQANGTILYTPTGTYSGSDTFTYTVRDNSGQVSNVATVTVNVNAPPVAVDDSAQALRNVPLTVSVLSNDTDVDGTLVLNTVTVVTNATHGTAVAKSDGTIVYTPTAGYTGSDLFTYTVRDDDGAVSNVATVTINVVINPYPWRNPINSLDVNADGKVTPIDALLVINDLNYRGTRDLPNPPVPPLVPPPYLDTNGNNRVETQDALLVINYLNRPKTVGEGEAADEVAGPLAAEAPAVWFAGPAVTSGFEQARTPTTSSQAATAPEVGSALALDANLQVGEPAAVTAATPNVGNLEDVLDRIAEDVGQARNDDVIEDLAIDQLLFSRRHS